MAQRGKGGGGGGGEQTRQGRLPPSLPLHCAPSLEKPSIYLSLPLLSAPSLEKPSMYLSLTMPIGSQAHRPMASRKALPHGVLPYCFLGGILLGARRAPAHAAMTK